MKRIVVLLCCLAMVVGIVGCDALSKKKSPEEVGKAYVESRLEMLDANTAELEAEVTATEGDKATVHVTGIVKVDETVDLVKVDGKWQLAEGAAPSH